MGSIEWDKEIERLAQERCQENDLVRGELSADIENIKAEEILIAIKDQVWNLGGRAQVITSDRSGLSIGDFRPPTGKESLYKILGTDDDDRTMTSYHLLDKAEIGIVMPGGVFPQSVEYFSRIITVSYRLEDIPQAGGVDRERINIYILNPGIPGNPWEKTNDVAVTSLDSSHQHIINFFARMISKDHSIAQHGGRHTPKPEAK